jgi:hypothetical protein
MDLQHPKYMAVPFIKERASEREKKDSKHLAKQPQLYTFLFFVLPWFDDTGITTG